MRHVSAIDSVYITQRSGELSALYSSRNSESVVSSRKLGIQKQQQSGADAGRVNTTAPETNVNINTAADDPRIATKLNANSKKRKYEEDDRSAPSKPKASSEKRKRAVDYIA